MSGDDCDCCRLYSLLGARFLEEFGQFEFFASHIDLSRFYLLIWLFHYFIYLWDSLVAEMKNLPAMQDTRV